MRKVKAENIKNEDVVKIIMDNMIPINKYLDLIDEDSFEYENICDNVQEQFNEILEGLNLHLMKYTNTNICIVDLMLLKMWDYLREETTFDSLMKYLKDEYEKRDR